MDAKLSDAGTLEGHVDFRGKDLEYLLRSGFRPCHCLSGELGQRLSANLIGGEVGNGEPPEKQKNHSTFHKYTRARVWGLAESPNLAPVPFIASSRSG
jgi:hypothetical protein